MFKYCYWLMLLFGVFLTDASAQDLGPSDPESNITFTIKNFGLQVEGRFSSLQGLVRFDTADLAHAVIELSVAAATINTGNDSRDAHLKKAEYFNVQAFPQLVFISDKVVKKAAGSYLAQGKMTIKGITKAATIAFSAKPQKNGYMFSGKLNLNRRDFNIGGSSMVLSDNLVVLFQVQVR